MIILWQNLAFTASILKSAQRSEVQCQAHICEEKLSKLREELSKSEQDRKAIHKIIEGLRKAFDSPDHSSNVWDGSEDMQLSEDLFANADKLLKFAMATQGQPSSCPSLSSTASRTYQG